MHTRTFIALFGTLFLLVGCPEEDDPSGDDDTTGDDDDTGDDDTGDDDTGDDDTDAAWQDILAQPDPEGDADGYMADIESYQFQFDGQTLKLRITSYTEFDDQDPDFQVDMCFDDPSAIRHCLTYDNVMYPDDPLRYQSSSNGWAGAIPSESLFHEDESPSSVALGIDLDEIGLAGQCRFHGSVGVQYWDGYPDLAPDATTAEFVIDDSPVFALDGVTIDDSSGNDDGRIDPGETVGLSIALANRGCGPSGGDVTATASVLAEGTATVSLVTDTVVFGGGAPVDELGVASADGVLQLQVDPGAEPGQDIRIELLVTDDEGGSWTVPLTRQVISYPAEVPDTLLLEDPDDSALQFDISAVSYRVEDAELVVTVDSHDTHEADLEVIVWLYAMLGDEMVLYALDTLDYDTGQFTGSMWYATDGVTLLPSGTPSSITYDAGTSTMEIGCPLAAMGNPTVAYVGASAYNADYSLDDFAPDTPWNSTDDLPAADFVETR